MKKLFCLFFAIIVTSSILTSCSSDSDSNSSVSSAYPILKASLSTSAFYVGDSDSTLKNALEVKYYTNDSSFSTITDYTLSGWESATTGTRTVTISYKEKSVAKDYAIMSRPSADSISFTEWTDYVIAKNTLIDIDSSTKNITLKTYDDFSAFLTDNPKTQTPITPSFLWADGPTASIPALYFQNDKKSYYIYDAGEKLVISETIGNPPETSALYQIDRMIPEDDEVYVSEETFTISGTEYYLYAVPSNSGTIVSFYKYDTVSATPADSEKIADFEPSSLVMETSVIKNESGEWKISYNNAGGIFNIQVQNASELGTPPIRCYKR